MNVVSSREALVMSFSKFTHYLPYIFPSTFSLMELFSGIISIYLDRRVRKIHRYIKSLWSVVWRFFKNLSQVQVNEWELVWETWLQEKLQTKDWLHTGNGNILTKTWKSKHKPTCLTSSVWQPSGLWHNRRKISLCKWEKGR